MIRDWINILGNEGLGVNRWSDKTVDFSRIPVWPDLVKFRHFGQIFGKFSRVYLVFDRILNLPWEFFVTIGYILTIINGQILEN